MSIGAHPLELVLLAAVWGSSFLFMRIAAPDGTWPLFEMRSCSVRTFAALFLAGTLAINTCTSVIGTRSASL